ncbi:PREDICTED: 5-oxoprolinase [Eufriesea mexicana]|uniref:5-oxoprolinase n=1 Tax=Eufriesea mexicana TaxID=516756 RepID=UPI00083C1E40|nr:PREDICTED: 5-oxoprolinase [Eufriesea mexicana]
MGHEKFEFAIDRGGTFTDVYARCPGGKIRVMKLLSVDPANYEDAPREGIRRILEQETGKKIDGEIDGSLISWIRMGTTVATNALLERKGARMALLINEGFKDLLYIGNQARPNIFDLQVVTPEVLYEKVIEVKCRVIPALPGKCNLDDRKWRRTKGSTGEDLFVTRELDEEQLKLDLEESRISGIDSLAVVLAHSYTFAEHEKRVGELAKLAGFPQVSLSHEVMPMARIVPRGFTACADAYLTPHIKQYLQGFSSGFKDKLKGVNVLFMQSDGGLTPMDSFNGSRAILSGPAGGVVGYAMTTYGKETDLPVIGFDMGGTSTDVSRYGGSYEHVYESTTAGVTIQAAQLDVNTVAAGGGSMLFFRSGLFEVGPESAGAHPGPACYKKNGPLAVTDANLALGRLLPEYFPKIFGPNENEPLDRSRTMEAFRILTNEINEFLTKQEHGGKMTVEEVAMGFVRVANETMCRPIRALTQAKGYDTSRHVLACFGGAGGQHACAIARSLGMGTVFVHKYAGILSAYGMALADVVEEAQEPSAEIYERESYARLDERLEALERKVRGRLAAQGFPDSHIRTEPFLHLRYQGTDCALMCTPRRNENEGPKHGDFLTTFLERYQTEFGFTMPNRRILVSDIRVRGAGKTDIEEDPILATSNAATRPEKTTMVYFENGYLETKVYQLRSLSPSYVIHGPAIIMDSLSTLLIEPDCTASITSRGDVKITIGQGLRTEVTTELDTIQLSIFSHRFMSIAEQMGRILQRTAISTNIKERLDFSCAVFGPDGGLVSNAPHIPVHLGAMQETVQFQMRAFKGEFSRGDVILANHPCAGGSHLPDLTVITPVFYRDVEKPVFFVASRGHHADIGGITPGSMPPHSTSLLQEGATFKSFLLVHRGVFREKELTEALMEPGKIPGSSGTRNLSDNLSDLKAQIAANHKGSLLVNELIDIYGLDVVQAYMGHIQHNAEVAVRDMLKSVGKKLLKETRNTVATAVDYLDDGSPIKFLLNIDIDRGEAVCDFTGTGYEVWGNCNAPRAITLSALIYCLRCIVGRDVPLNQGCLKPVKIIIPKGSLLDPSEEAAVVGGNVLTSQRVVDVVLQAFGACAASQGCMNNVTLGTEEWGYYETVAGGSGAGPTWNGRGGVHTHMTNTRITDPEILELRYPVILDKFSLRPGSGGAGAHHGGDGVVREMTFRAPMMLSVLTERRVHSPPGLAGGQSGQKGRNTLQRADGRRINLGPKTAVPVRTGDKFILETPGGGGYGPPGEEATSIERRPRGFVERGSVYEYRKAQESV